MGGVLHGAGGSGHSGPIVQFVEPLWSSLPLARLSSLVADQAEIGVYFADLRQLAPTLELEHRRFQSRALLRLLLGALSAREPDALEFTIGPHGKPQLLDSSLQFNVSHSGDLWLLAVSPAVSVGVDIEAPRTLQAWQRLADRVFTTAERAALELETDPPLDAFFTGWTRKEAVLKGLGTGLGHGPKNVEVGITRDRLSARFTTNSELPWQVVSLSAPVPSHAAVAWPSGPKRLRTYYLTL